MNQRKILQHRLDINPMDINVTEADLIKTIKSLLPQLKRTAKKPENNWQYKIWIIISTHDGNLVYKNLVKTNGRGGQRYHFGGVFSGVCNDPIRKAAIVPAHIHILIISIPGEALVMEGGPIASYLRKKLPNMSFYSNPVSDVKRAIDYMNKQTLTNGYNDSLGNIKDWDYSIIA